MKPEHVIEMGNGGHMCKSCGGMVDAEGYSEGGEVDDGDADELTDANGDMHMRPREVGGASPQMEDTERMRQFSEAMKGWKK